MDKEPIAILYIVRAVIVILAALGIVTFTDTETEAVVTAVVAVSLAVGAVTAAIARSKVDSPATSRHKDEIIETLEQRIRRLTQDEPRRTVASEWPTDPNRRTP